MSEKSKIDVLDDGPMIVSGLDLLEDWDGKELPIKGKTALCRCGASENKPFCDGSHKQIGFSDK
ncbi:MAG: CDGSH iron-sulfur domain-containing protein [Candidatus Dadabacteria bacterium]|nr:CDGSH iron-sulfur domain-containing protein [Candidatus Dadabacteria bacterium]